MLETQRGKLFEEFAQDQKSNAAIKYWLQTAIQAVMDISSHICARLRLAVPPDGGECIRTLEKQGLIPQDRATVYVKMIRFRNVLVHLYGEVDNQRVYDILENELDYFRAFMMDVDAIIEAERKKKEPQRQPKKKS